MDPVQQEEMDEQCRWTNWTSSPPRVPPEAPNRNILPSPVIYETRAAAGNNRNDADHRWAQYLHSTIDANREQPPTLSQLTVAQPLMTHISHSPAHANQVHSQAPNQMPPDILPVSATTENTTLSALWDQTRADAAQWTALDIVEPKDQNGQSVLMQWVARGSDAFYCRVPIAGGHCSSYNAKKDRILSHVRKDHLNFRPFHCGGVCGNPYCKSQFSSNSAVADHKTSPITCENCGKTMRRQNYKDHLQKACTSNGS